MASLGRDQVGRFSKKKQAVFEVPTHQKKQEMKYEEGKLT